ncbi:MAG: ABC transporter permease [Opitutae bacterium]
MRDYVLRRLLLIPLTFFGITLVAFLMTRLVPGGPIERAMAEKIQAQQKMVGRVGLSANGPASPEELDNLKRQYGFDRPVLEAYGVWLGIVRGQNNWAITRVDAVGRGEVEVMSLKSFTTQKIFIQKNTKGELNISTQDPQDISQWKVEAAPLPNDTDKNLRVVVFQSQFHGILQGSFGYSSESDKPVIDLILQKLPLSIWFGFWGMLIAYFIAVPLGISKAIRNGSLFDSVSSVLIFFGFAIPGFVLALSGLYLFCFHFTLLPHSGFNWDEPIKSTILPLACESAGAFAAMTMFMKNSLLDNLSADYMRTAKAKGVSSRRALYVHALRNSIIPLAASFGQNLGFFLTGSFLIEYTFDIDGIGLLSYDALVHRDFPVFLGLLTISSLVLLIGNILSDLCVAAVDPRIRFQK